LQDLQGREKIKSQVKEELSKNFGLKLTACILWGVILRKRLVSKEAIYIDFQLLRIKVIYKRGRKIVEETLVVYPADMYRYGRKTLDVVEEIAYARYREEKSWRKMGNDFYEKYDFPLNNVKRTIKRMDLVFNRLVTSDIVSGLNLRDWLLGEERRFEELSLLYLNRLISGSLSRCRFQDELFSG
jgi:hypothetical protein